MLTSKQKKKTSVHLLNIKQTAGRINATESEQHGHIHTNCRSLLLWNIFFSSQFSPEPAPCFPLNLYRKNVQITSFKFKMCKYIKYFNITRVPIYHIHIKNHLPRCKVECHRLASWGQCCFSYIIYY